MLDTNDVLSVLPAISMKEPAMEQAYAMLLTTILRSWYPVLRVILAIAMLCPRIDGAAGESSVKVGAIYAANSTNWEGGVVIIAACSPGCECQYVNSPQPHTTAKRRWFFVRRISRSISWYVVVEPRFFYLLASKFS